MIIEYKGQYSLKTISKEQYKLNKTDVLEFCNIQNDLYSNEEYIDVESCLFDNKEGDLCIKEEKNNKKVIKRIIKILCYILLQSKFNVNEIVEIASYPKNKIKYYDEADWNMNTDVIVNNDIRKPKFLGIFVKNEKKIIETVLLEKGKKTFGLKNAISSVSRIQFIDNKVRESIIICFEIKRNGKLSCTIVEVY